MSEDILCLNEDGLLPWFRFDAASPGLLDNASLVGQGLEALLGRVSD